MNDIEHYGNNVIKHCGNCRYLASKMPNSKCDKCVGDDFFPSWEKTIDQKYNQLVE